MPPCLAAKNVELLLMGGIVLEYHRADLQRYVPWKAK
jgi:hypothetical protein